MHFYALLAIGAIHYFRLYQRFLQRSNPRLMD